MMQSLRRRLTVLALGCISAVIVPLLALSYAKVAEEVGELSDARLAQSAKTLEALSAYIGAGANAPIEIANWVRPKGASEATAQGHGYETQIGFQYWTSPTELKLATHDLRDLAFSAAPIGFADTYIEKRRWRVYTKIGDAGGFIRAAERYDSRREIIRDLLLQDVLPILIGLPLLALLMGWAIRKGLQPLATTALRIEQRSPHQVGPIDGHDAPDEIAPLIRALNGLLHRLGETLDNERQFTATAAHELRTPLAGALVHIENALESETAEDRRSALVDARNAIHRMNRLVNQMLELARWDSASAAKPMIAVDLAALVDAQIEDMAEAANLHDVTFVRAFDRADAIVSGWEAGLRVLVRNLLDNASRHAGRGATVVVEITRDANGTLLAITDNGPGVPEDKRNAVLRRFQRGDENTSDGAGLGLPIVQRIADVHRASLRLASGPEGRGLRVEVRFPL
ncbi:MAG TPA: ATP-binding protein [Rhodanobacteraceae bacterium]|nr:ATP-binding protein [Rhodanobacteraceae bacterium]